MTCAALFGGNSRVRAQPGQPALAAPGTGAYIIPMNMRIPFLKRGPVVSVLRLNGPIGAGSRFSDGLNDAALAPLIERAFRKGKPVAVAIAINSPGGSPTQSALIGARIRRLVAETGTQVHVFIEDMAASGGYWLACAGDHIWADETSLIGSIGVISAGFGFPDFMHEHGIERRVHTAGKSKSFMDPFRPETEEDRARIRRLLDPLHESFKAWVRARRGDKLSTTPDLFTGDIWTGGEAQSLGLIDGLAHLEPKMKELFGQNVRFARHSAKRPFLKRFGLEIADGVVERTSSALRDPGTWSGWR